MTDIQSIELPSNTKLSSLFRRVKYSTHSLYNRLYSIHNDSIWLTNTLHLIKSIYNIQQCYFNRSCSIWYYNNIELHEQHNDIILSECYFKSGDTHHINIQSFNFNRLNLHILNNIINIVNNAIYITTIFMILIQTYTLLIQLINYS